MMSGGSSSRRVEKKRMLEASSLSSGSPPPICSSESEEEDGAEAEEEEEEEEEAEDASMLSPPATWRGGGKKRVLTKQLSMRETRMEVKWEKRKRQMLHLSRRGRSDGEEMEEGNLRRRGRVRSLTDEDLDELRGSIELGFGFTEEEGGQDLCRTLPALNLYFAVNRQLSDPKLRMSPSPASTPTATATSSSSTLYGTPSPRSPDVLPPQEQQDQLPNHSSPADSWKIFKPGDSPQHVKMRLRHWAQVVACSVRHCC